MANAMCIAGFTTLWSPADEPQHNAVLSITCKAGTQATGDMTSALATINTLYLCKYGVDHADGNSNNIFTPTTNPQPAIPIGGALQ